MNKKKNNIILEKQLESCQRLLDTNMEQSILVNHVDLYYNKRSGGDCRCQILIDLDEGIKGIVVLKRNVNSDYAKRKLEGCAEAHLIEIACRPALEGYARWTLRLLEEKAKIVLPEH